MSSTSASRQLSTATAQASQHRMEDAMFTEPRASHRRSRLMRLPTEIRLIILRELLITATPIGHRQEYISPRMKMRHRPRLRDSRGRFMSDPKLGVRVKGYLLSPEILATCQTFFNDGWPILYGENVLQIRLETCRCSRDYACLHYPNAWAFGRRELLGVYSKRLVRNACTIALILRFNRFQIRTQVLSGNNLRSVETFRKSLVELRPMFANKELQVMICGPFKADRNFEPYLKSFKLWRCKTFGFTGVTANEASESTAAVVTSTRPIANLCEEYQQALRAKDEIAKANAPTLPRALGLVAELEYSMNDFDEEKFSDLAGKLARLYSHAMKLNDSKLKPRKRRVSKEV